MCLSSFGSSVELPSQSSFHGWIYIPCISREVLPGQQHCSVKAARLLGGSCQRRLKHKKHCGCVTYIPCDMAEFSAHVLCQVIFLDVELPRSEDSGLVSREFPLDLA
jgi:hypothetical protein